MRDLSSLRSRKGAFRIALIPEDVLAALHQGLLETVNLNEFLALDLALLAPRVAQDIGLRPDEERLSDTLALLPDFKPMKRHAHLARALYDLHLQHPQPATVAEKLASHPSDVARAWATQWITLPPATPLSQSLQACRRFAADPHFSVREFAWMAVRDAVIADLETALLLLRPWVLENDPNLRRFACELTRPRGVWCAPIKALQTEPWQALPLLEALRADPSRYVQNSVANWLNDASKSQGPWVEALTARWLAQSPDAATRYIVKRARRTLDKATLD